MSKKKKDKKSNIPLQTTTRPRLEQIVARRAMGELDEEEYLASVQALADELGRDGVLNAMLGLLISPTDEQRDAIMLAIPKLGDANTIAYLWQYVRRSKASVGSKMTALVILKQMGETVNLENPGEYFSWRDIKHADIAEVTNIARFSSRALIKELQQAENTDEVENMMIQYEKISGTAGGDKTISAFIDDLVMMGDSGAADMLLAISATTPRPQIREAARKGLLKLAGQKVFPQSEVIKSLVSERFYAAYSTNPAHPWQQGVAIAFERSKNNIQAIVFLLDFGHPWQGSIKDLFPTHMMTPSQFQKDFINKSSREPKAEYRRTTFARARQFILDALEANRRNRVKLPPEYNQFRHLIERRIVDPSPEVLTYAAQVDANTVDEWPPLPGEPVQGMEIIGPDGQPMPVAFMGGPDQDFWDDGGEDDLYTLKDLLDEVEAYYFSGDTEEETEILEEGIIEPNESADFVPYEWAIDYLSARSDEGIDVEELDERWMDLADLMYYADTSDHAPTHLTELQGYHLSELVIDFWNKEFDKRSPRIERQHTLETIQDLYAYLAAQAHIPKEVAIRVEQAVTTLLSHPQKLTPIPR